MGVCCPSKFPVCPSPSEAEEDWLCVSGSVWETQPVLMVLSGVAHMLYLKVFGMYRGGWATGPARML